MDTDSEYEIEAINGVEADAFQGLSKTYMTIDGQQVYIYTKPENIPVIGQLITGSIARDKRGSFKFTKKKLEPFPSHKPAPVNLPKDAKPTPTPERVYKADPDKMKQEYTLEQARNMSIQRQVAAKLAVELVVAGKASDVAGAYVDMMRLLAQPDWKQFENDVEPISDDVVPITLYDEESFETELDRAIKDVE